MKLNRISSSPSSGTSPLPFSISWLLAILLGLTIIGLYWPVMHNDFVNYDDSVYVVLNGQVQSGLTFENFKWAFCHTVGANWHPLTMLSHMLDCQLYGLKPWGHHLTSLLLHAANIILLFHLLNRLTGALWRSAWVAAIFAFHPLHVESVAWVAERKDVLSTFFGFLALIFYVRYVHWKQIKFIGHEASQPGNLWLVSHDYWFACLCFALGLLCKPMLVTWPFVLLLLDYWPLNRFQNGRIRSLIWEKIPFFILGFAACATTFLTQKLEGAVASMGSLTLAARSANVPISYCRYLLKLFWPVDLAVFYPLPKRWLPVWVILAVVVLAGLSGLIWLKRRHRPFLLTGWLWFVGTLVPVIGLVQVGGQAIADRYTYIPSVGILILISWGGYELTRHWRHQALALSLAGVAAILLCCGATRAQIGYWKDSETLALHTLMVTRENYVAHNNLGLAYYFQEGRTNEAVNEFQQAIQANPVYADAHMNLGMMLDFLGQTNPALSELQKAVELDPAYPNARYHFGGLLLRAGQTDAGLNQFKELINFKADAAQSWQALANLLLENGQTNVAISQLQEASKVLSSNSKIHYQLGNLFNSNGQTDDAISQFQETIRLKPVFFEAHNNLASLLSKKGLVDQAIAESRESIRLKPDYAETHYNLGAFYLKKGLDDMAAAEFQTAIRLSPDFAPAHYYLGNIMIRKGQTAAAITQFQEAIHLRPDYAFAHNKLGIAFGTIGRMNEAIAEFQEAVRLKPDYAEANTNLTIAIKMQATSGH